MKSSLLSLMTHKSFSETLFLILIMIFLHLKLGNVLGVPRVLKWRFQRFNLRKLLKNHLSKNKKSFWSFLVTSALFSPSANKVLLLAKLQPFELWTNRKMSLIKALMRRGPRKEPWGTQAVISCQQLKSFSTYIFKFCLLNNFA